MNYHYPTYPLVRTNSAPQRFPPDDNNKITNLDKAIQDIRYHQPFERLEKRYTFQKLLKEKIKPKEEYLSYDNFALFDAICKRGGFNKICAQNRWEEITISLCLDKKNWNFTQYYYDIIFPHESKINQLLGWYPNSQIITHQFLELHLLPNNNITSAYYQITPAQTMFMQANFFSIDQYFNLKTIALLESDLSKVPVYYADKYMIMRKRLLFSNQLKDISQKQLRTLSLCSNSQTKVVLIGFSLQSLMIADKLSQCGLSVVLIDRVKKVREESHMIESGIVLLEGGKQKGSYYSYLNKIGIAMEELGSYSALVDQDGKVVTEQKIRVVQQHFMGIVNQLKEEVMNKKKFYEQLMSRVLRKKLQHQKPLLKWHYDRYMLFNRIKGQYTTVSDLVNYESKKFVKHITHNYSVVAVRSWQPLIQKIKSRKNVRFINQSIQNVLYSNNQWNIKMKDQYISSKYLVYCDHETISKAVLDGTPKIAQIGSDIMGQSTSILHQLTILKYVNCLYTFKDKVALRQSLQNHSAWTVNCSLGYIYYFLLPSGNQVLAVLRFYPNSNINYYNQIYNILDTKCLSKGMKLIGDSNWGYQCNFSLKDEKSMENLIRIKQNEKMFLVLPITTVNCPHKIPSIVDIANFVCMMILEDNFPDYTAYDPAAKKMFKQDQVGEKDARPKVEQQMEVQNLEWQSKQNKGSVEMSVVTFAEKRKLLEVESVKLQAECFGLSNPLVKNYQNLMKQKIGSNNPDEFLWSLNLQQQVQLSPTLYLYSLGQPHIYQKEWFSCILSSQQNTIQQPVTLNKIITRKIHFSLSHPIRSTVYYQMILAFESQILYCIVDENEPKNIYFHNNMQKLIDMLNQYFSKIKEEDVAGLNKIAMDKHPPKILVPTSIQNTIKKELQKVQKPYNFDILLQQKLAKTTQIQRSKSMSKLVQRPFDAKIQQISKIAASLLDINNNISLILKQIESYTKVRLSTSQLKHFTICDIFFGIFNDQYICCQIMKLFEKKPLNFDQIQKHDKILCNELKEVMDRQIPNEKYEIMIENDQQSITIHRNFLHRSKNSDFELYSYRIERKQQKWSHFLIIDNSKIQFDSKQDIFVYIIKHLIVNCHNFDIIKAFQELVNKDIEKMKSFTPKIKLYSRMVKMNIKKERKEEIVKLKEKCKDLEEKQREKAVELMRNKKMLWVENDFVFVVK